MKLKQVILCAEKDDIEVEYALRTKTNPIGVATYELQSKLPPAMKGKLPSARQLRAAVRSVLPDEKAFARPIKTANIKRPAFQEEMARAVPGWKDL